MLGRCIAGKELSGADKGQWIRPVSRRPEEEISETERQFENGGMPKVLDILSIKFIERAPHKSWTYQTENWLIDTSAHWKKKGEAAWKDLEALKDMPDKLWKNGDSSSKGKNDRIPESEAASFKGIAVSDSA